MRNATCWLIGLAMLLGGGASVLAQEEPGKHEATDMATEERASSRYGFGVYAGQIFGDTISEATFVGEFTPELDDSTVLGGLMTIAIAEKTRLELRLGLSSTTVLGTPNGDIGAKLYYFDLAYVPRFGSGKVTWGVPFGVGWATLDEDGPFTNFGQIPDRDPSLIVSGGSGVDFFVGLQAEIPLGERLSVIFDGRFKRFHRLQNVLERTAKTTEITVGLHWRR